MERPSTQEMIDDLTDAFCGPTADSRQKYLFEQTLHALVRLAKSEQMNEIKTTAKKLTAPSLAMLGNLNTKAFPHD